MPDPRRRIRMSSTPEVRGACLLVLLMGTIACGDGEPPPPPPEPDPAALTFAPELGVDLTTMTRTPSGVYIQDTYLGGGSVARTGREVVLTYTGWLHDGTVAFSSSQSGNWVGQFGETYMIPGWHEGLEGMREGGRRKIVVPARLAYGVPGLPPTVPPQSVLVISMELLDVR